MAKRDQAVKKSSRQAHQQGDADVLPFERSRKHRGQNLRAKPNERKRVECLNEAQGHYYLAMKSHQITFSDGPAGTGKSHVAVGLACEMLMDNEISQIVITRPIQGVGEDMGFLPGELEEKFDPFFAPIRKIMESFMGYTHLDNLIKNERVIVAPLQFIRGHTFDSSFVILDEAQNTTPEQMKAFLTRIGKYTTFVINGDAEQIDIKGKSGLVEAMEIFKDHPKFGYAHFEESDIVRSDIVKDIILGYRNKGKK